VPALGAADAPPSASPWVGWHFTGTVTGTTWQNGRSVMAIRVEWQRLWENGARLQDGPKGLSVTSLRDGERLELDRVVASGAGACGTCRCVRAAALPKPAHQVGVSGVERAQAGVAWAGEESAPVVARALGRRSWWS
jgi:hypothetical protein